MTTITPDEFRQSIYNLIPNSDRRETLLDLFDAMFAETEYRVHPLPADVTTNRNIVEKQLAYMRSVGYRPDAEIQERSVTPWRSLGC